MEKIEGLIMKTYITRENMKYFAMFTMVLNHVAHLWEIQGIIGNLMLGIGYFTGPCMCVFLVEGFYHSRSVPAYLKRLLVIALLSQLPFNMLNNWDWLAFAHLNMMFSLAACLILCMVYESNRLSLFQKKVSILALFLFSIVCDWFYLAPLFVYTNLRVRDGSMTRHEAHRWQVIMFLTAMYFNALDAAGSNPFLAVLYLVLYLSGPCMLTYCLMNRNEGESVCKSLWSKWFFYLFYPGHMLVLVLIKMYLIP